MRFSFLHAITSIFRTFLIIFTLTGSAYPSKKVQHLIDKVKVIHVSSTEQKVLDEKRVELRGDVEVVIDHDMRLWADHVLIDKHMQTVCASADPGSLMSIQTHGVLVTTPAFTLNLHDKTGTAYQVKVHLDGGFISAENLEKSAGNVWELTDLIYTACDQPDPHWSLRAQSATIQGNYLIRASNLLFYLNKVPVLGVPRLVVPLQKQAQSGFLLPKLSYDHEFGFGIKQAFYWRLAKRFDTTIGFAWKERRGIVLTDELRWARAEDMYTYISAEYARERNAFIKKRNAIVKGVERRFWIEGENFETHHFSWGDVRSLINADFGTDKRVGYFFFSSTQRVSDYSYNAVCLRHTRPHSTIDVVLNGDKTVRNQFSNVCNSAQSDGDIDDLREVHDKFFVSRAPHVNWSAAVAHVGDLFDYSHELFIDHLYGKESSQEFGYQRALLTSIADVFEPQRFYTWRAHYKGAARFTGHAKKTHVNVAISPELAVRSQTQDALTLAQADAGTSTRMGRSHVRGLFHVDAEWALPQFHAHVPQDACSVWVQPALQWNYTPKLSQDHWFFGDKYDRIFARNECVGMLRTTWNIKEFDIDLMVRQGYEFFNRSDILPLRRGIKQNHLLPLEVLCDISYQGALLCCTHEYELSSQRSAHIGLHAEYALGSGSVMLGICYQDRTLQKNRELYSDIPLFVYFGIDLPVTKRLRMRYNGQFYARGDSWRTAGSSIRPLIHQVVFEYTGHCWSAHVGFEEKRYRQQGHWRTENAFVISFGLDTLGSVVGKLSGPGLE